MLSSLTAACLFSLAAAPQSDEGDPANLFHIYEQRTAETVDLEAVADELVRRDVVFLGEEHGNATGHRLQRELIEALYQRRPDLVVSLEMFERDVQGVLDDYLRDRIDEDDFLGHARPWKNYEQHYRPIVEFAREKELDVIAANVPRRAAQAVAQGDEPAPADRPFLPRETTCPRDAYWERFLEIMQEHAGVEDPDGMEQYYRAQCLKDDAMAEAIADYLARHAHRRPLVVHLGGRFHSDYGHGTVIRLLSRRPLLQVGVISMETAEEVDQVDLAEHRERSHFLFVVPPTPHPDAESDEGPERAQEGDDE